MVRCPGKAAETNAICETLVLRQIDNRVVLRRSRLLFDRTAVSLFDIRRVQRDSCCSLPLDPIWVDSRLVVGTWRADGGLLLFTVLTCVSATQPILTRVPAMRLTLNFLKVSSRRARSAKLRFWMDWSARPGTTSAGPGSGLGVRGTTSRDFSASIMLS